MRRLPPLLFVAAVCPAATAAAQSGDHGAFVTTLGRDTVAVEQYTRRAAGGGGNVVEGDVLTRLSDVRVTHYRVALDASGRATSAESSTRTAAGAPAPAMFLNAKVAYAGDSARYDVTYADSVAHRRFAARAGTLPVVNYSYAVYEIATRRARATNAASDTVRLLTPAGQHANLPLAVTGDSARLDYFGDPIFMRVDRDGRVLAVDGTRTTNKVTVARVPSVDFAALTRSFAARPALGTASPTDSVRATVGGAQLLVVYGRPSVRGRTVWGGVLVPYGTWWRTGANAATAFRTSADLTVGGVRVPAGSYTLFTQNDAAGSQLIISKKTGEWGTEYDATQDLARVPLTATALAAPVEQFTIAVDPTGGDAGVLRMRWADRELSVPVAVAR